jgi:hypothetical protein
LRQASENPDRASSPCSRDVVRAGPILEVMTERTSIDALDAMKWFKTIVALDRVKVGLEIPCE